MSLLPISSMAWSQDTRVHWPLTSFIGYFRRRSPCTSSRTAAPLAQCEPRLMGESQPGSWPIHTPFATSATTVQPTEQWVQMFLRMVTCAPAGAGGPAFALRMLVSGSAPSAARLPAASPERRKKDRRSRPPFDIPCSAAESAPRRTGRSDLRISMIASSARIPINAVVGLHVLGLLVTRLAFLIVGFRIGPSGRCERARGGCRDTRAGAERAKEIAPPQHVFALFLHDDVSSGSVPCFAAIMAAARMPVSRCP